MILDDFDLGAIEARQHRPGHNLVDRADHRRACAEIEHAVDRVDERVELVGAEHDRDLEIVADAPRGFDDALLMRRVERDQRLVEQQQARPAEQCLAEQHLLALAARQFADRALGKIARADFVQRPVDLAPDFPVEADEAEAASDRGARDHVPTGEPQACYGGAVLRHVADCGVTARNRLTEDADRA